MAECQSKFEKTESATKTVEQWTEMNIVHIPNLNNLNNKNEAKLLEDHVVLVKVVCTFEDDDHLEILKLWKK